jgi:MFS family permease
MLVVVWQPYAVGMGTTFTQLGTIQAIITVFSGLGSLFWGRVSDEYGRKPAHIGTMLTRIVAVLCMYTADDLIGLILFGVFIGFAASWTQTSPVTTTLLSESVGEDKMNTAFSLYSSAGTLVAVLASPLGGFFAVNDNYYLIFLSCIMGELLNMVLANLILKETLSRTEEEVERIGILQMLVPENELLPFYLISMMTMFSWRVAFSNLNAILVDSYGITAIQLGLMVSAFSISYGLTQTPFGLVLDRNPKRQFLLISRIGFLAIAVGYLVSKSFLMLIFLQVVNGVSHSFGVPSLTYMVITKTRKEQRATILAKFATLPQVVSIPAPIIGGYLYEQYGFDSILMVRVLFLVTTVLITIFWIKPEPRNYANGMIK